MSKENPNKFLNYLMEIGLIDDLTSQNLYNIYNNFFHRYKFFKFNVCYFNFFL